VRQFAPKELQDERPPNCQLLLCRLLRHGRPPCSRERRRGPSRVVQRAPGAAPRRPLRGGREAVSSSRKNLTRQDPRRLRDGGSYLLGDGPAGQLVAPVVQQFAETGGGGSRGFAVGGHIATGIHCASPGSAGSLAIPDQPRRLGDEDHRRSPLDRYDRNKPPPPNGPPRSSQEQCPRLLIPA
jgi:hypothetical protein